MHVMEISTWSHEKGKRRTSNQTQHNKLQTESNVVSDITGQPQDRNNYAVETLQTILYLNVDDFQDVLPDNAPNRSFRIQISRDSCQS